MSVAAIDEPAAIGRDDITSNDTYVFDIEREELFALGIAPKKVKVIGGRGVPTHKATWYRRAMRGSRDADGVVVVRLPTVRLGRGGLYTSIGAINWYIARMSRPAGSSAPTPARSPAVRSRAAETAARELDRIGI